MKFIIIFFLIAACSSDNSARKPNSIDILNDRIGTVDDMFNEMQ